MASRDKKLLDEFDQEMLKVYHRALEETQYRATRFLTMLNEHGGLRTAQILLHASTVSEGYAALWQRNRLDLTVEAVIYDHPKWHPLFSHEELRICQKRLRDYQYISGPLH